MDAVNAPSPAAPLPIEIQIRMAAALAQEARMEAVAYGVVRHVARGWLAKADALDAIVDTLRRVQAGKDDGK